VQIVRHAAKSPKHGRRRQRKTTANHSGGASMAEDHPEALGALDCGSGTRAFERFTGNEAFLGAVYWDSKKLRDVAHNICLWSFVYQSCKIHLKCGLCIIALPNRHAQLAGSPFSDRI
jgi:hypothetical protein